MSNPISPTHRTFNPLITTIERKDSTCVICLKGFKQGEEKWTHEEGENHDPLHKNCFKTWLKKQPTCPHDRVSINLDPLLSTPERIYKKTEQFFSNLDGQSFFLWIAFVIGIYDEAREIAWTAAAYELFCKKRFAIGICVGAGLIGWGSQEGQMGFLMGAGLAALTPIVKQYLTRQPLLPPNRH